MIKKITEKSALDFLILNTGQSISRLEKIDPNLLLSFRGRGYLKEEKGKYTLTEEGIEFYTRMYDERGATNIKSECINVIKYLARIFSPNK